MSIGIWAGIKFSRLAIFSLTEVCLREERINIKTCNLFTGRSGLGIFEGSLSKILIVIRGLRMYI